MLELLNAASPAQLTNTEALDTLPTVVVRATPLNETLSLDLETGATAINAPAMLESGGRGLREAVQYVANVTAIDTQGSRVTTFTVRGSREPNYQYNFTLAPAVSVYRNGLPSLSFFGRSAPLYGEVEEVRFLRGPQGTRYGFGGAAGLVEIRHQQPQGPSGGQLRLAAGSYNRHEAELSFHTAQPQANLRASLDLYASTQDGWFENIATGGDFGAQEWMAGRTELIFGDASGLIEARLTLEMVGFEGDFADVAVPFDAADLYKVNFANPGFERSTQDAQALELLKRTGLGTFQSITGRQGFGSEDQITLDVTGIGPPDAAFSAFGFNSIQAASWTQEFRFVADRADSTAFGLISAGAFAGYNQARVHSGAVFRADFQSGLVSEDRVEFDLQQETLDLALFSEWQLAGTKTYDLLLGLRGEANHRYGYGAYRPVDSLAPPEAPYPPQSDDRWYLSLQPSLEAKWRPRSDLMTWAKLSTGYRPGGFNIISLRDLPFEFGRETSFHFELGMGTGTATTPLQTRLTAYSTWFDGYHAYQSVNVISQGIVRARSAYAYGGELEAVVRPWIGGALTVTAGLTEARFQRFNFSHPVSNPATGAQVGTVAEDFSGNRINYIPRVTARAALEQRVALPNRIELVGTVSYAWNSGYFLGIDNETRQEGFGLLDAQLRVGTHRWELCLFARNLTNAGYFRNAFAFRSGIIPTGSPGDPRTFGVAIKRSW